MEDKRWYIAVVAPNTERVAAERLGRSLEVYLPSQKVVSVWRDGRRKLRDQLAIPGVLFVYCNEIQRLDSCNDPCIRRYMVDMAAAPNAFGKRPVATVPEDQILRLKFILGQHESKVLFNNENLKAGEAVRVVRGPLSGLDGIVSMPPSHCSGEPSRARVFINISHLGCASVEVAMSDIERV